MTVWISKITGICILWVKIFQCFMELNISPSVCPSMLHFGRFQWGLRGYIQNVGVQDNSRNFYYHYYYYYCYASAFRRRRHYVFGLSVRPSVRPSVRRLKYPLLTCTWVRWSTRPTVTILRHVRPSVCPSVRLSVRPSGEVSGHLPENAWRD